jgi:hypothetical protein
MSLCVRDPAFWGSPRRGIRCGKWVGFAAGVGARTSDLLHTRTALPSESARLRRPNLDEGSGPRITHPLARLDVPRLSWGGVLFDVSLLSHQLLERGLVVFDEVAAHVDGDRVEP